MQSVQSALSKTRQEASSAENLFTNGDAPLVPSDESSYFSSREKSDSEYLENVEVEQGSVRTCIWKQMQDTSPYPTEHSRK